MTPDPHPGLPPADPVELTRITLRPIATPFPLAFLALAIATTMVAGRELGWFPERSSTVALVLVAFTFPLQALAAVFGFLGRDTVAATGFGVQAGTWLVIGISGLLHPGKSDPALGAFLIAAASAVLIAVIGAALGKLVPAAVLGLTGLRFALTGIYELGGGRGVEHVAAVVGLGLAGLAGYAALALEVENLKRRTVLPLGRHSDGHVAMQASLAEQTERIHHEAGVREQL